MGSRTARYVALLRGVNNIGATTRISMTDLRILFEDLGFRDVRTLLNSGNVVFSAPDAGPDRLAARLEKALTSTLGVTSRVTVLSSGEVATVVRGNPLRDVATSPSDLLVMVPRTPSELGRLKPLLKERWSPEVLALGSRVAYLWCANGVPRSPVWNAVDRALDRSGTVRNIATFTKVLAAIEGT